MVENYRHIEEFRNMYPNEQCPTGEVWIIGGGKSLEDFPKDFFENKTSIAVNYSIFGFPHITHFLSIHKGPFREVQKKMPEMFKDFRSICAYTMDPNDKARGLYENRPLCGAYSYLGDWGTEVMYLRFKHKMVESKEEFKENAPKILSQENCKEPLFCLARGTTVHMAMQAAIILGAKKITVVGCETRGDKYRRHAFLGEMGNYYKKLAENDPQNYINKYYKDMSLDEKNGGIDWMAQVFKLLGVLIRRYYFKEGEYGQAGYEEIKD